MNNKPDCHPDTAKSGQQTSDDYISIHEVQEIDTHLRSRYGLPPRLSEISLYNFLKYHCNEIRSYKDSVKRIRFHKEDAIASLIDKYSNKRFFSHCRAGTRASIRASHLEATPAILKNPDYLPRRRAAQLAGVKQENLNRWTRYMQIIPYWDDDGGYLLYSVSELKKLAPWRQFKFIEKHLGYDAAMKIKATREKKQLIVTSKLVLNMYYVPELAHLWKPTKYQSNQPQENRLNHELDPNKYNFAN